MNGRRILLGATVMMLAALAAAPAAAQVEQLQLKWVRDAEEFAALVEQIYRVAAASVRRQVARADRESPWAVILDVDETVLDNSTYPLELATYETEYDTLTWHPFVERRTSPPLPGVAMFLSAVRALGGRVAFISNRAVSVVDATRDNLAAFGLYVEGDLLCLQDPARPAYTKAARRGEVRSGTGACSWAGERAAVLAYLGDSMNDLPRGDEDPGELGERLFVLPNPMYGDWVSRVTRKR